MKALWITLCVSVAVLAVPVLSHAQSFEGDFLLQQNVDFEVLATTTISGADFGTSTVCVGTQNSIDDFINDLDFIISNGDYDFSVYQPTPGTPLYALVINSELSSVCSGNSYAGAIAELEASSTPYIEGEYQSYSVASSTEALIEAKTEFYNNASKVMVQIFYLLDFGFFLVALYILNKLYDKYIIHKRK